MWICAKCGTQAQKPEICSGCGSKMLWPKTTAKVQFALLMRTNDLDHIEAFGPFNTAPEAEAWWRERMRSVRFNGMHKHDIVVMESVDE